MRDELKNCQCGQPHPWGILRYSEDQVPLYGPRAIATCRNFRPVAESLPAMRPGESPQEIWAQTGDLNPQATLATRLAVTQLRSLAEGKGTYSGMVAQWPEFIGFVISQITDMRGALVRDESKFAHLVAHTDEIVEAMRGVTRLNERLTQQSTMLNEIREQLEELKHPDDDDEALKHFGLMTMTIRDETFELRKVVQFRHNGGPQDAILTEAESVDDEE